MFHPIPVGRNYGASSVIRSCASQNKNWYKQGNKCVFLHIYSPLILLFLLWWGVFPSSSVRTRIVSEPYLLRTFSSQKYFWTEKLRTWYGASTVQVGFDWKFRLHLLSFNLEGINFIIHIFRIGRNREWKPIRILWPVQFSFVSHQWYSLYMNRLREVICRKSF